MSPDPQGFFIILFHYLCLRKTARMSYVHLCMQVPEEVKGYQILWNWTDLQKAVDHLNPGPLQE